jgi:hypothetical protein
MDPTGAVDHSDYVGDRNRLMTMSVSDTARKTSAIWFARDPSVGIEQRIPYEHGE